MPGRARPKPDYTTKPTFILTPLTHTHTKRNPHLRRNPLWIPREQTTHPDIRQPQPKLHDTLKPKASTRMRRASVPEAVDVVLCARAVGVDGRVMFTHLRGEELGVVDTLRARADLLAAHEHVVRVGEERVVRRGHRVGGADG